MSTQDDETSNPEHSRIHAPGAEKNEGSTEALNNSGDNAPGSDLRKMVKKLGFGQVHRSQSQVASPTELETRQEQLDEIAKGINAAHDNVHAALKQGAHAAMEAGRLLCKAKELVPHGQWRDWLSNNTTQSERTAQLYMQFARKVDAIGDEEQAQRVAELSFRSAMAMLGTDQAAKSTSTPTAIEHRSEVPAKAKAMKATFRRLKDAIRPILDGDDIDPAASKDAIRVLKELIALLKESDITPVTANTTSDDFVDSEVE